MAIDRTLSFIDAPESGRGRTIAVPFLTVVMDTQRPLTPPARHSLAACGRAVIGRAAGGGRTSERTRDGDVAVLQLGFDDSWMSAQHAQLVRGELGWTLLDTNSKNGTVLNGKRIRASAERLRDGDVLEIGAQLLLFREGVEWTVEDPIDLDLAAPDAPRGPLATVCLPLAREIVRLRRIAPTASPVLIFGESGSGKEVFARALHELSGRGGAFVAVNCGALPTGLVESQLFGHRRGAFSGADSDRHGLVRAADGGTLFLDEIAELPESSQVALLRVLQEGEVTPVGATSPERVDLRVLAATHQDIAERRAAGRFRDDLYGRLAGFTLTLPPLAERREDLGLLVAALLPRIAGEQAKRMRLSREAGYALAAYDWPLNIRELEHALATAVALAERDVIELADLPPAVRQAAKHGTRPRRTEQARAATASELEQLLAEHSGNISAVARALRSSRVQVHRLLERFGLDPAHFRD